MKKPPLSVIGGIIFIIIVFIVIWYVKSISGSGEIEESSINTSSKVKDIYQKNCARCHGNHGQGFIDKPSIKNTGYSAEEIKQIISKGLNDMPSFSNISEPDLSNLAKYVSQL